MISNRDEILAKAEALGFELARRLEELNVAAARVGCKAGATPDAEG